MHRDLLRVRGVQGGGGAGMTTAATMNEAAYLLYELYDKIDRLGRTDAYEYKMRGWARCKESAEDLADRLTAEAEKLQEAAEA